MKTYFLKQIERLLKKIVIFMHFPGSKNTCFYTLEEKIGNENRVPSILGLRLKVTVILLIYPFFDNTKFTFLRLKLRDCLKK